MSATFRTRPWLIIPLRPTSLSPFLVGAPRLLAPIIGQTRYYAKRLDPQLRSQKSLASRESSKQKTTQTMMKEMLDEKNMYNSAEMATLAPGTIAHIPLFKGLKVFIDRPADFFTYYWYVYRQKLGDRFQIFQMSIQAKGGWFVRSRPEYKRFRASRNGIIETALYYHVQMSHCVAGGTPYDRDQLAKICVPKLERSLLALIESRPPGKSYKWKMVKLLGLRTWPSWLSWLSWLRGLTWPRIVDHKWTELPLGGGKKIEYRQAVVGIKSRQTLTELNARRQPIGTPREMVLTEYLVMWRKVDTESKTLGPWLVSGTLKETGLEEVKEELDAIKSLGDLISAEKLREKQKLREQRGETTSTN